MKKFLLILLTSSIFGCSSIELGDALSSEEHTQKILALGLSHEENLVEANKLSSPHLVSVVSLQLTNARDEKIQYELDLIESKEFEDQVLVSNNGLKYTGSEITESIKTGILATDLDLLTYYLEGIKEPSSAEMWHKIHLTVFHNSKTKREYLSANKCDKWGRCEALKEDGTSNKLELKAISANASNCTVNTCDYSEVVEINLSDSFLKSSIENGISINLISKKKNHKIKVSKPYLMGYLKVAK